MSQWAVDFGPASPTPSPLAVSRCKLIRQMSLQLKPNHASVKAYYETLHQFGQLYIDHEGAVRSAFQTLLSKCGQRAAPKLTLVPEYRIARGKRSAVVLDGALVDLYHLPHGYWEAKDEKDDLLKEVQRKLDKGYPSDQTRCQSAVGIALRAWSEVGELTGGRRFCNQSTVAVGCSSV
jgi:hypothetical protein